jgi:integrase
LATLTTYAFPHIGSRPVAGIDVAAILEVLKPIWTEKAETARRVRQRLDQVMNWAEAHGYAGKNPVDAAAGLLPKQRDKVEHHRALPYVEVPGFVRELRKKDGTSGAMALLFLVLTATRTGEVRKAARSEFDLRAGSTLDHPCGADEGRTRAPGAPGP